MAKTGGKTLAGGWQHNGLDSLSESSLKLHTPNTKCQATYLFLAASIGTEV
jgi:hypothetical protein